MPFYRYLEELIVQVVKFLFVDRYIFLDFTLLKSSKSPIIKHYNLFLSQPASLTVGSGISTKVKIRIILFSSNSRRHSTVYKVFVMLYLVYWCCTQENKTKTMEMPDFYLL
jgi:hypothetical protein